MTVSDIEGLKRVMKKRGFEYEIVDETSADVYSDITVSEMAKAFEEENCSILTLTENEEDLESFYLELLGGDEDA
jgi:hypothetical protein